MGPRGSGEGPEYYMNPKYRHRLDRGYKNVKGEAVHRGPTKHHFKKNTRVHRPRDVGKNWEKANVLLGTKFRYFGQNAIPDLLLRPNLRSLLEVGRIDRPTGIPTGCIVIDAKRPEWKDINEVINWLFKHPVEYNEPNHSTKEPNVKEWRAFNKNVDEYRYETVNGYRRNNFNRRYFGFPKRRSLKTTSS